MFFMYILTHIFTFVVSTHGRHDNRLKLCLLSPSIMLITLWNWRSMLPNSQYMENQRLENALMLMNFCRLSTVD